MLSRRQVLKGLAATGALSATPAWALLKTNKSEAMALPRCDITIYQHQSGSKEMVSLMNLTNQPARLDAITPVGLEHINGSLVVRLNQLPQGALILQPGERLTFEIEALSKATHTEGVVVPNVLAGQVQVKSDHPAFNGVIPVTVFDGQTV